MGAILSWPVNYNVLVCKRIVSRCYNPWKAFISLLSICYIELNEYRVKDTVMLFYLHEFWDVILYGRDIRTCLRALEAGLIPTMSELLHESEPSFEHRLQNIKETFRCYVHRLNYSAVTFPSKRIGTSWTVSHIKHNSESILTRNDSTWDMRYVAIDAFSKWI